MYQDIELIIENRVATIYINRPQVSNALARSTYGEIQSAVTSCEENEDVGCIVITGRGKHFSAGGDIVSFKKLIDDGTYLEEDSIAKAAEMSKAIRCCAKPVIAMINGTATGAGLSVALAFIKMGLSGDTGAIYFLNKLLGVGKATEMIMTGMPVGGEEAYRLGLLNRLAEEGALEEETYRLAQELANAPLVAIKYQKDLINEFFYSNLDDFTVKETKYMAASSRTADFAEAVNAFLEKRAPKFTGK